MNVNKKSRGLGNLQKTQQIETEDRVLIHFLAGEKRSSYFREIQRETKISPLPLKKALERLVKKNKILVISGFVGWRWITRNVSYRLPTKQYLIANLQNIEYVDAIKKERQARIKTNQENQKQRLKQIEQRKKNRLTKSSNPLYVRDEIAKALVRIVYFEEDEKQVLDEIGITKKTFESRIKRSPRFKTIIKLLKKYKRKKKDLPFKNNQGQLEIPYSAIWIKRRLMYPLLTKKKNNQWFRK